MVSLKTKELPAAFGVPTLWMSKTKEHHDGPVSPVPFSKEDRDKYIPMGWATKEGQDGEIHSCLFLLIFQTARSHPGEVLMPNHTYGWTPSGQPLGHRTNVCHVCSLIPLQVLDFEILKQLLSSIVLRKVKEMHLMLGGTRTPGNSAQPGQS